MIDIFLFQEGSSDFSVPIAVNNSQDYLFYAHNDWFELFYLQSSIYPYQAPLNLIEANNNDGNAADNLKYEKKVYNYLQPKSNCTQDLTSAIFRQCILAKLADLVRHSAKITCKVPGMSFFGKSANPIFSNVMSSTS